MRVPRLVLRTLLSGTSRHPASGGLLAHPLPGHRAPAARCAPCWPGGGGWTGLWEGFWKVAKLQRKQRLLLCVFLHLLLVPSALGVVYQAGRSLPASQSSPTPGREDGAPGQRGRRGAPGPLV